MRELPVADFDFSESTVKKTGSGNALTLRLCKADFDFLLSRNFNTYIAIRNLTATRSKCFRESTAERISRIEDNQNGICMCVCDMHSNNNHKGKNSVIVKISNAVVNADKSLCRFKVERA